ncbi:MAG TPA: hypothetical protein VJ233_07670 [Hyphomicrobiaceae bacterium]|nr:hypothetical protein [Hyphomicrobiaceae bacterium]
MQKIVSDLPQGGQFVGCNIVLLVLRKAVQEDGPGARPISAMTRYPPERP